VTRPFFIVDVFAQRPYAGNQLAVVVGADGLSDETMQAIAAETNYSETTFVSSTPEADRGYRVRIFTPAREMPFAGHPTLGSCAAWLRSGGTPGSASVVRQECGVGIVDIDIGGPVPAFAAPPTTVAPLPNDRLEAICAALKIKPGRILRSAQLANGPAWSVLELRDAEEVLAVDASLVRYPAFVGIGLIGAHPEGSDCGFEVRMLAPSSGMAEDPITGSLNAAIACWMYGAGFWQGPVTIAQGTRLNRQGRVFIRQDGANVWVGGQTCFLIEGTLTL
jgi:PhzF family phenazine biosynthesis protein